MSRPVFVFFSCPITKNDENRQVAIWAPKILLVQKAGNFREWSIIVIIIPATPSNPQQPIHSSIHSLGLDPVRKTSTHIFQHFSRIFPMDFGFPQVVPRFGLCGESLRLRSHHHVALGPSSARWPRSCPRHILRKDPGHRPGPQRDRKRMAGLLGKTMAEMAEMEKK